MEGTKMEIQIKGYPEEAKNLVKIWDKHINSTINGLGVITFVNARPKQAKESRRKIAGLEAESIAYVGEERELIKMTVENFIYLMAKSGVEIEIKEVADDNR